MHGRRAAALYGHGLAYSRIEDRSMDDVVRRTDIALYQAKGAGRNCIRAHVV